MTRKSLARTVCTTLSSPDDARKCDVYDPSRCNGTVCVECVDGEYCEPCQRGFDSDREEEEAGDECYGAKSCKKLTLVMAGGGSHWWNYVVEGDKVYIEGKLQTRKWTDKDNVERYVTEIAMQAFDGKLLGHISWRHPVGHLLKDLDEERVFELSSLPARAVKARDRV